MLCIFIFKNIEILVFELGLWFIDCLLYYKYISIVLQLFFISLAAVWGHSGPHLRQINAQNYNFFRKKTIFAPYA